jgi:hypothetical protein
MTWTATGSGPSIAIGTAATGTPAKEIGWVKMPTFGRAAMLTPSKARVSVPSAKAGHGVAGAISASTESNSDSNAA